MNLKKETIIQHLFANKYEDLYESIHSYLVEYPYDVDMYGIAGFCHLQQQDLGSAEKYLLLSLKHNYYDVDTYFLLGELYFMKQEHMKALEYYKKAEILYSYYHREYLFFSLDNCTKKFNEVQNALAAIINLNPENALDLKTQLDRFVRDIDKSYFLLADTGQLSPKSGAMVYHPDNEQRFCAYYEPSDLFSSKPRNENLFPVYRGKDYSFSPKNTTLVPIASIKPDTNLNFTLQSGQKIVKAHLYPNRFNYYRTSENVHITSEDEFVVGMPVHLAQDRSLKKLVLSFFIDGLSWQLLKEEGLKKTMPNTFQFFSKGLIFDNFFTTSDWTYPSLPSFVCGYSVPRHMMIHPYVNRILPNDTRNLFAYMKKAGYYTAMLNCDPRTSSTHGYTKHIDRYITQHPLGYKAKQVIPDTIEHIHAFRETNQYLWITIADLHDIADEIDLSTDTITQIDITKHKLQRKSVTSVKQLFSPEKRNAYIQALHAIDIQFASLYQYIESTFDDNEFVVTLFGDHGQTYLLKPEEHHLSRYHSNAGFMIRGSVPCGNSSEYISALDYSHILCKLAGTEPFQSPDGQLPKIFGGNNERKFTITETIHPGDPYMAAFHAPTHTFYYTSEHVLTPDARLEQGTYQMQLIDANGLCMEKPDLVQKYIALIDERLKYIYMY